jgi:hypothetical protein
MPKFAGDVKSVRSELMNNGEPRQKTACLLDIFFVSSILVLLSNRGDFLSPDFEPLLSPKPPSRFRVKNRRALIFIVLKKDFCL